MSRRLEDGAFTTCLTLSVVGHVLLLFLRAGADTTTPPDVPIEEREAQAPMTVRVVLQEALQPPVLQAEATAPLLTSEAGERSVRTLELDPVDFERVRPDDPPPLAPPLELPEPIEREPEPREVLFDLPERPQEREAPPPEPPTDLVRPVDEDLPEPQLQEQQAQSAAITKKAVASAKNRAPSYPRRARAARMEGVTEIRVHVTAAGRVERVELASSSGHELLDDEAMKTVKRWRFAPAVDGQGNPVPDVLVVPITFRLKGR